MREQIKKNVIMNVFLPIAVMAMVYLILTIWVYSIVHPGTDSTQLNNNLTHILSWEWVNK